MVALEGRCSDKDGERIGRQKVAWARDRDKERKAVCVQKWWPLALGYWDTALAPLAKLPAIWTQCPVSWEALRA